MLAVQLPGLAIAGAPPGVVISWPSAYAGYMLQQSPTLPAANWAWNTNIVSQVNGTNQVTISPATNNMFFRLAGP